MYDLGNVAMMSGMLMHGGWCRVAHATRALLRTHVALASHCALAIDRARLYREAKEATRAREELLAEVSHDLRSPIGAVQLAAAVAARCARRGSLPALLKSIGTLNRAAARATRLVDDQVDSTRLERGCLVLERKTCAAAALAREALDIAAPVADAQGVRLAQDVAPDAGAATCDAHRILQVLSNLTANSLKVMPEGGALRLSVRRAPSPSRSPPARAVRTPQGRCTMGALHQMRARAEAKHAVKDASQAIKDAVK